MYMKYDTYWVIRHKSAIQNIEWMNLFYLYTYTYFVLLCKRLNYYLKTYFLFNDHILEILHNFMNFNFVCLDIKSIDIESITQQCIVNCPL